MELSKLVLKENYGPWQLAHRGDRRWLYLNDDRAALVKRDLVCYDGILEGMPESGQLGTQFSAFGHRLVMDLGMETGWLSALMVQPVNGEYFERTLDPHLCAAEELAGRTTVQARLQMFPGLVLVENLDGSGRQLRISLVTETPTKMVRHWDGAADWLRERELGGRHTAMLVEDCSTTLFRRMVEVATAAGLAIEQTCFEFGLLESGQLCFGGDLLTPELTVYRDLATGKVLGRGRQDWIGCLERLTGKPWPQ